MISMKQSGGVLYVVFPKLWEAKSLDDLRKIESIMTANVIRKVAVDLSAVNVLNGAIVWLHEYIRSRCADFAIAFEIARGNVLYGTYFGVA